MVSRVRLVSTLASGALLAGALLGHSGQAGQAGEDLWAGKAKTGRTVQIDVTCDLPPEEVFALWTTREGIRKFFAPEVNLDGLEVGGRYEIVFDPVNDPRGAVIGTNGARILRVVPGKELAVEWAFPPFPEVNQKPFPTWVEVELEPAPGAPGKTLVHFAHHGFGQGETWDRVYAMFKDENWPLVLGRFEAYCTGGKAHAWPERKKREAGDPPPGRG